VTDVAKWADYLLDAESRGDAVAPITDVESGLTLEQAYDVQRMVLDRKTAAGEQVVGAKLGLTSRAKQEAMGVYEPVYGVLTDAMVLPIEEPVRLGELIHPRVEPEIVFILDADLSGPGVTVHDVVDASSAICCGLEIIDSRYADFRFTLGDVVADNTSAARFVLGPAPIEPTFDLRLLGCLLEVDGRLEATAAGAAVLGHPAEAVARLANWLARRGEKLRRGWKVLSGGLTDAVPLAPGRHITATFGRLGALGIRAVE
jgi:2-oxo-3-hexenedioate decarboxylase